MVWSNSNSWWWLLVAALVGVIVILLARKKMKRGTDIVWPAFPENLSWTDAAAAEASLGEIYKYSIGFSNGSVAWYQDRRRPKRVAGFLLRVSALIATVLAGLVPLSKDLGMPEIYPQVSTVLLAMAGVLVSIDGLGGFTSGWVRYMLAQLKIERARDTFLMEWNNMRMVSSERQALLDRAKIFLLAVGKIVDDETQEWAIEFQSALKDLERARKAEAETPRTGALEITVKNPQLVAGWTLEIDGNQRGSTTGKTLAVNDVAIGQRKVRTSGKDVQGNKTLSDEKIVKIEAGVIVARELELS